MVLAKIFEHAHTAPERVAIVHNGAGVRYRDFAQAILIARAFFEARAVAAESVAVVCIENLRDAWVMMLALRSLGVHTLHVKSADQIAQLDLPAIKYVVTTGADARADSLALAAQRGWADVLVPDNLFAAPISGLALDQAAASLERAPIGGHILLTSGTTGQNKMVFIGPDTENRRLENVINTYGFDARSVLYLPDFGAWSAGGFSRPLIAWLLGTTIIFEQRPGAQCTFLAGPTTDATLTVSGLAEIMRTLPAATPRREDMRVHIVGGALPWPLAQMTISRITRHLFNSMGSTEAGTIANTLIERQGDQQWYRILPNRQVEIVDAWDKPVPRGDAGYVRIKLLNGDITGYHGEDPRSREFFRDGFFYSGDLGAFGPDGRLTLHGRATDVISINGGEKIATAPLEQTLQDRLSVTGACVFSVPSVSGADIIHVAIESTRAISQDELRAAMAGLPFACAGVHLMNALPRNEMGKINRIALRHLINTARSPT